MNCQRLLGLGLTLHTWTRSGTERVGAGDECDCGLARYQGETGTGYPPRPAWPPAPPPPPAESAPSLFGRPIHFVDDPLPSRVSTIRDEIRDRAKIAEAQIREALRAFERETGCEVTRVSLTHSHPIGQPVELHLAEIEWGMG